MNTNYLQMKTKQEKQYNECNFKSIYKILGEVRSREKYLVIPCFQSLFIIMMFCAIFNIERRGNAMF